MPEPLYLSGVVYMVFRMVARKMIRTVAYMVFYTLICESIRNVRQPTEE